MIMVSLSIRRDGETSDLETCYMKIPATVGLCKRSSSIIINTVFAFTYYNLLINLIVVQIENTRFYQQQVRIITN